MTKSQKGDNHRDVVLVFSRVAFNPNDSHLSMNMSEIPLFLVASHL